MMDKPAFFTHTKLDGIAQGLLFALALDEHGGGYAHDSSRLCGATGAMIGMDNVAAWASAQDRMGLLFDGSDDKITLGAYDLLGTKDLTRSAWIYLLGWGGGGAGRIMSNAKADLRVSASKPSFSRDGNTTTANGAANSLSATPGPWYHVAVTSVVTPGTLATSSQIYVNGKASGAAQSTGTAAAGNANLTIGNQSNATNRAFNGTIAIPCAWARALSAAEIARLYSEPWCLWR
jgi:hypothetical protein